MKRILIVRLSAIGDVVMASPLAKAFKDTWKETHVTWIVEEPAADVLRGNPYIDEVIVWPRARWKSLFRERRLLSLAAEFFAFRSTIRSKPRFDLAVDVQGLLKSGIWTYLSGAREKVGLGSREGSRFLMNRVIERTGPSDRISSQYLLLARKLELRTDGFPMTVPVRDEDRLFVREVIAGGDLADGYAVLCPFTTRPQKHWFDDRWIEIAGRLKSEYGLKAVLLGGPGDIDAARSILDVSGDTIISLTGETTITQAAALIEESSVLVGVDTGLTHIGFALGIPTIALFGATRPYLDTDWMPGKVLYHPLECSPCRRSPTCEDDYTCMKAITVDEVLSAAGSLLGMEGEQS